MKWYVFYSLSKYDASEVDEFDSEDKVIAFLNKYASNAEFEFKVIHGTEITYEAVSRITEYTRKRN